MLPTYPAILSNNRVEWTGDTPLGLPARVRVHVTLLDQPISSADQGTRMAAVLELLASRGGIATIHDPAAWEREQREERKLPGRES